MIQQNIKHGCSAGMSTLTLCTVDAFADGPFTGNPAGVVLVPHDVDVPDEVLQKIGAEVNLSETAFLKQLDSAEDFKKGCKFGLRWFTPTTEVPLCGHATLASAAVLFDVCGNVNDVIEFETLYSGSLFCRKTGEKVTIELPLGETGKEGTEGFDELLEILCCGHKPVDVSWNASLPMLLVRLPDSLSLEAFENFQPDIRRLQTSTDRVSMVTVTMKADPDRDFTDKSGKPFDFVSRFFAPWFGIDEDPFTGAAHTVLSDYWSKQLGKKEMHARQCSSRGGIAKVNVKNGDRVELTGKGTIFIRGTISF